MARLQGSVVSHVTEKNSVLTRLFLTCSISIPRKINFMDFGRSVLEHISDILAAMREAECEPQDGKIIIDDSKHYYKSVGQKRPKCVYCFKFSGDDVVGWFMDYSMHNKPISYFTRKNRTHMSDAERAEFKKRYEREKKERQRKIKQQQERSAIKAANIWSKTKRGDHAYLKAKGATGLGTHAHKDSLIVPAYKNGKITTLQFISSTGDKKFLYGGEIQGAYGSIGKDTSRIYISEGYATADAIYQAVTPYVSVWAFNAGNLIHVSKTIRDKYPEAEIVIAADNDQWQKLSPKDEDRIPVGVSSGKNKGIVSGREAADAINAKMVWPDFPADDENRDTDFNDYLARYGKDMLKNRLEAADFPKSLSFVVNDSDEGQSMAETSAPPAYLNDVPDYVYNDDDFQSQEIEAVGNWGELLICDSKGNPVKTSLKNTILFLQHHDKFKGLFRYNEFNHQIMTARCPVWDNEDRFRAHVLNDVDISETAAALEAYGLSPDRTRVHNAIEVVSHNNGYHPAREYFDALEWDGEDRLSRWLSYYLGAEDDNPDYLSFIGRKWLTAAVKRVYEPACKFDHVLVMEGKQGAGKSTALKELSTFGRDIPESYFTDAITIADIQNKDTIQKIQGSIIVELAELAGFNKKDDEEIKRWITLQHDDCRLPYARTTSRFNRQFVLSATTNSYDYLKDPTGNRRYWPVKVGSIDMDAIKHDRTQLWAQAVRHYKEGLYIGPTPDEMKLAEAAQSKRRSIDTWEDDVLKAITELDIWNQQEGFKTGELMREMGLVLRDQTYQNTRRITNILQQNGYENAVIKKNGKSIRVWRRA